MPSFDGEYRRTELREDVRAVVPARVARGAPNVSDHDDGPKTGNT